MTGADSTTAQPVRRSASLLFNVSTLLQESIGAVRQVQLEQATGSDPHIVVTGSLRLLRTDHSILATASLTTAVTEICGGCLNETPIELSLSFDEEYWPTQTEIASVRQPSAADLSDPMEREGFAAIDGQIDLSEAVRQYVEMARPMSPRCGPDCPGLATETPSERNSDDRWAPLASLKLALEAD